MEGFFLLRLLIATHRSLVRREAGFLRRNQLRFSVGRRFLTEPNLKPHEYAPSGFPPVDMENKERIVDDAARGLLTDYRKFERSVGAASDKDALFKCPLLAPEFSVWQLGRTKRYRLFSKIADVPRNTPSSLLAGPGSLALFNADSWGCRIH